MTTSKRRIVERKGQGKIYKEDNWLADVYYNLVVEQESVTVGTQVLQGSIDAGGKITVIKGERDLIINNEGPFTLHSADGRKWKLHVSQGDPVSAGYQVSAEELIDS